jgi:hypothetical protein
LEVAIKLDIPQVQVTQLHLQFRKLIGQDKLVILHSLLGDRIFTFFKLYKELIIKSGMSIERVFNLIKTALDKLPYVETHFEQAKWAADKHKRDLTLENRIRSLEEEERRKLVTLHPSSYHYANDREDGITNKFPYYSGPR